MVQIQWNQLLGEVPLVIVTNQEIALNSKGSIDEYRFLVWVNTYLD